MILKNAKRRKFDFLRWAGCLAILALSGAGVPLSVAQTPAPEPAVAAPRIEAPSSQVFPPRLSTLGLVFLPNVRYDTETGFGLGGKIYRKFTWLGGRWGDVPSDLQVQGMYTTKGQKRGEIVARLYFPGGRYYVKSKVEYDDFALRFWGLGPNSQPEAEEVYRPRSIRAYLELFRRIAPHFKAGVRYEYQRFRIVDAERGSRLAGGSVPGTGGQRVMGAGFLLDFDTRDRPFSPTRGCYYQFFSIWFDGELGSDYDFDVYHFDLRNYFPLGRDHVLATQVFVYSAMGGAPFWRYAALGGRAHTRGYRKGRYLDHSLLAFQAEYRFPIRGRFGLATFAGLGNVAADLDKFQLEHLRPTIGAGLRYQPRRDDPLKLRLDMAAGEESVRLYLSIDEAY